MAPSLLSRSFLLRLRHNGQAADLHPHGIGIFPLPPEGTDSRAAVLLGERVSDRAAPVGRNRGDELQAIVLFHRPQQIFQLFLGDLAARVVGDAPQAVLVIRLQRTTPYSAP